MSKRTIAELLAASKETLERDPMARDLTLIHLERAATAVTYIAWQLHRSGAPEDVIRELLTYDLDLRRAYVKLGGYVHPVARAIYPDDEKNG